MSSIDTSGPNRCTARRAARTSSVRRARRWPAQRVDRPSGASGVGAGVIRLTKPTVSGTVSVGHYRRREDTRMAETAARPARARSTRTPATNPPGPRRAVVVGGNRIPFARAGGPYAHVSSRDLLTAALDGLVARFGLAGERVGEVVGGAVLKHSRDFNLTRE